MGGVPRSLQGIHLLHIKLYNTLANKMQWLESDIRHKSRCWSPEVERWHPTDNVKLSWKTNIALIMIGVQYFPAPLRSVPIIHSLTERSGMLLTMSHWWWIRHLNIFSSISAPFRSVFRSTHLNIGICSLRFYYFPSPFRFASLLPLLLFRDILTHWQQIPK